MKQLLAFILTLSISDYAVSAIETGTGEPLIKDLQAFLGWLFSVWPF